MKKLFLLLILLVSSINLAFAENHAESPVNIPAGYTLIDSVLTDNTAMLLVEYPDTSRSFWGCLLTENGWQITESSRLPSGAVFDTIPAGAGQIAIYLKETDGVGICYNICGAAVKNVTVNRLRDVRIELDNGIAIETHISNGRFNDAKTEQWSFFRRHDHSSPYVTVYQTGIDIAEEW